MTTYTSPLEKGGFNPINLPQPLFAKEGGQAAHLFRSEMHSNSRSISAIFGINEGFL